MSSEKMPITHWLHCFGYFEADTKQVHVLFDRPVFVEKGCEVGRASRARADCLSVHLTVGRARRARETRAYLTFQVTQVNKQRIDARHKNRI